MMARKTQQDSSSKIPDVELMWPLRGSELIPGVNDTWNKYQQYCAGRTVTPDEWRAAKASLFEEFKAHVLNGGNTDLHLKYLSRYLFERYSWLFILLMLSNYTLQLCCINETSCMCFLKQNRKRTSLTKAQAIEIFKMRKEGQQKRMGSAIARIFGVTPKAVRDIWIGKTWADATDTLSFENLTSTKNDQHYCVYQRRDSRDMLFCDQSRNLRPQDEPFSLSSDSDEKVYVVAPSLNIHDNAFQLFPSSLSLQTSGHQGLGFSIPCIAFFFGLFSPILSILFQRAVTSVLELPSSSSNDYLIEPNWLPMHSVNLSSFDSARVEVESPCSPQTGLNYLPLSSYPTQTVSREQLNLISASEAQETERLQRCEGCPESLYLPCADRLFENLRFGTLNILRTDENVAQRLGINRHFLLGSLMVTCNDLESDCSVASEHSRNVHTFASIPHFQLNEETSFASVLGASTSTSKPARVICFPLPLMSGVTLHVPSTGGAEDLRVALPELDILRLVLSDLAQVGAQLL
jgi:hypothetical protein